MGVEEENYRSTRYVGCSVMEGRKKERNKNSQSRAGVTASAKESRAGWGGAQIGTLCNGLKRILHTSGLGSPSVPGNRYISARISSTDAGPVKGSSGLAEFDFPGMRGPGTSGDGFSGSDVLPSSKFWGATTGWSVGWKLQKSEILRLLNRASDDRDPLGAKIWSGNFSILLLQMAMSLPAKIGNSLPSAEVCSRPGSLLLTFPDFKADVERSLPGIWASGSAGRKADEANVSSGAWGLIKLESFAMTWCMRNSKKRKVPIMWMKRIGDT